MAKIDYKARFRKYVSDVHSGRRKSCLFERLAVERHLSDLNNKAYVFDINAGDKFCKFFNLLRHFKGPMAGEPFVLEPWQVFTVMSVVGWKDAKTGFRRFRYADVVIPRKNGKSTFAAGLALAFMMIDGEMGAEVYSAGTDRDQAKVVWDAASTMAGRSPAVKQFLQLYKNAIVMEATVSSFKPLSRDLGNKDGSNPHFAVCDERHAWRTNAMFEVLKSGMGARKQPMIFTITTAGLDTSNPYFAQMGLLKDILLGKKKQDNQFALIFCPDEGDDWRDPAVWKKVNPGIGKNIELKFFQQECAEAVLKGGTVEANFKTKNLNIWVDAPEIWISDDKIKACNFRTPDEELQGKVCYAGLDIASHVDINALALIFPEQPNCPVVMHYWLPEAKIIDPDNTDRVDYRLWWEQGRIHRMPGDVLDVDLMTADIESILRQYDVKNLSFDPYKAYHGLIQNLTKDGFDGILDEFPQSLKVMSEPTKQLEKMILAKDIDLRADPVLRWMFGNVQLYRDPNDNVKVHKGKSRNKVDGVVALINAIGGHMSKTAADASNLIYTTHTLRTMRGI